VYDNLLIPIWFGNYRDCIKRLTKGGMNLSIVSGNDDPSCGEEATLYWLEKIDFFPSGLKNTGINWKKTKYGRSIKESQI